MAFSKPTNIEDEVLDELSCTICMERYDELMKIPKLLTCGHTFCKSCLVQYADTHLEGSFDCPNCKSKNNLTSSKVDQLLSNHTIISLIGRIQRANVSTKKKRTNSPKCSVHDEFCRRICIQCEKGICSECTEDYMVTGENPHLEHRAQIKLVSDLIKEKKEMLDDIMTGFDNKVQQEFDNALFKEKANKWKKVVEETISQTRTDFKLAYYRLKDMETQAIRKLQNSLVKLDPPDLSQFDKTVSEIKYEYRRMVASIDAADLSQLLKNDFHEFQLKCMTVKTDMEQVVHQSTDRIPENIQTVTVKIKDHTKVKGIIFTDIETKIDGLSVRHGYAMQKSKISTSTSAPISSTSSAGGFDTPALATYPANSITDQMPFSGFRYGNQIVSAPSSGFIFGSSSVSVDGKSAAASSDKSYSSGDSLACFKFNAKPMVKFDERGTDTKPRTPQNPSEKATEENAAIAQSEPTNFSNVTFGRSREPVLKPPAPKPAPVFGDTAKTTIFFPDRESSISALSSVCDKSTSKTTSGTTNKPAVGSMGTNDVNSDTSVGSAKEALKSTEWFKAFGGNEGNVFDGLAVTKGMYPKTLMAGKDQDKVEELECWNVDVKPNVELPEVVDLKTGEEDEIKLFSSRAKLFRMDPKTYRIVMRREQVLKICANHYITPVMKMNPHATAERTWCWRAQDFADEELKVEELAIKFKTEDTSALWKKTCEECKIKLSEMAKVGFKDNEETTEASSSLRSAQIEHGSNSNSTAFDKLKSLEMVHAICSTTAATAEKDKDSDSDSKVFTFSKSFTFAASRFGASEESDDEVILEEERRFAIPKIPVKANPKSASVVSFAAGFGGFSFSGVTPTKVKSIYKTQHSPVVDGHCKDVDEDKHFFQSIVKLPNEYKLTTGEEGEVVIFCEKAKLFRFNNSTSEWKERGFGEVKLLKDVKSKKVRMLMRLEQVLKVCLNHYITPYLELKPMTGKRKVWVYHTNDFSEGEIYHDIFAIKFTSVDLANDFKRAVEDAKEGNGTIAEQMPKTTMREPDETHQKAQETRASGQTPVSTEIPSPIKPATSGFSFGQDFVFGKSSSESTGLFGTPSVASSTRGLFGKSNGKTGSGLFGKTESTRLYGQTQSQDSGFKFGASTFGSAKSESWFAFATDTQDITKTPVSSKKGQPFGQSPLVSSSQPEEAGRSPLSRSANNNSRLVQPGSASASAAVSGDDEDCVFVEEVLPPEDLQEKAESFQLPIVFYNYETKAPCPGCRGCDPEAFDFDSLFGYK